MSHQRVPLCQLLLVAILTPALTFAADPSQSLPAKGLVTCLEYDGLDAHQQAWQRTAAAELLRDTTAGAMLEQVAAQVIDYSFKSAAGPKVSGREFVALQEQVVRQGFALGVYESAPTTLVLRNAGRAPDRARFERLLRLWATNMGEMETVTVERRGRSVIEVKPKAQGNAKGKGLGLDDPRAVPGVVAKPAGTRAGLAADRLDGPPAIPPTAPPPIPPDAGAPNVPPAPPLPSAPPAPELEVPVRPVEPVALPELPAPPQIARPLAMHKAPEAPEATIAWWFEGDDMIVLFGPAGEHLAAVIDAREGHAPSASTHRPSFEPAGNNSDAFVSCGWFFSEPSAELLFRLRLALGLGLWLDRDTKDLGPKANSQLPRITGRWGFSGHAQASDFRLEVPAQRRGLLALLDQPSFAKDQLPPIPARATSFAIVSLDPVKTYDRLGAAGPAAEAFGTSLAEAVRALSDLRLREDILAHLGSTWACYEWPEPLGKHRGKTILRPVVLASLKDSQAFSKTLDTLVTNVNRAIRKAEAAAGEPQDPVFSISPLPAPERGYLVTAPVGVVPFFDEGLRPTILIGRQYVAFAASPEAARAALALEAGTEGRWRPGGDIAADFDRLPGALTVLTVGDAHNALLPELISGLPTLLQFIGPKLADEADDAKPKPNPLTAFGIPRPGGFRLRIDPAMVPDGDALRSHLLPGLFAMAVDQRAVRCLSRGSLPPGLLGMKPTLSLNTDALKSGADGVKLQLKWKFRFDSD